MYFPIEKSMKNAEFSAFLEKKFIAFFFLALILHFPDKSHRQCLLCSIHHRHQQVLKFHQLHGTSAWTMRNPPGGGSGLPHLILSHQDASFSRHRKCVLKTLKTRPPGNPGGQNHCESPMNQDLSDKCFSRGPTLQGHSSNHGISPPCKTDHSPSMDPISHVFPKMVMKQPRRNIPESVNTLHSS